MPPETSPASQISIEPYQNAFNKSVNLFSFLPPNEICLDGAVPVIQITSERGRPIEIPEMLRKFLERTVDSQAVMAHEVAFTPEDIFMVLETKDSDSPQIFGVVFNFKEKIFFARELAIEDTKSVSPRLYSTKEDVQHKNLTEENVSGLADFVKSVLLQPNARYSSHKENPIKLSSSFRYRVTTKGVS